MADALNQNPNLKNQFDVFPLSDAPLAAERIVMFLESSVDSGDYAATILY